MRIESRKNPSETIDGHAVCISEVIPPLSQFETLTDDEVATLFTENLPDYALFGIDLHGHIVSWNPGVERLLGYAKHEFIGLDSALLFTPHDNKKGIPERELDCALETGRTTGERWQQRKDGTRFWGSGVLVLLTGPAGEPRGFAKIVRDRTEITRAERECARLQHDEHQARLAAGRAQAAADDANTSKDRFISLISHEMRTPLTTLQGWLSLMRAGGLEEGATERALDTMDRNVQMIVHLVNDLLDIERIRSNKLHLEIEPVDLAPLVAAIVASFEAEALRKSIRIDTDIRALEAMVEGDESRLGQILWNLLSNALKFTPEGGEVHVTLQTQLTLQSHDAEVTLSVADNGRGIAPGFLPSIFEQFLQAEDPETRSQGGLGLGLSIVKSLVHLQGGTIEAHSEGLGHGARFIVHFPLYQGN